MTTSTQNHLRLVAANEMPPIAPLEYGRFSATILQRWKTELEEGFNLVGSFCWEFPYDRARTVSRVVGEVLFSQMETYDGYENLGYSVTQGIVREGRRGSLLGITYEGELETPFADRSIRGLTELANSDLTLLASSYRLPLPAATVQINRQV